MKAAAQTVLVVVMVWLWPSGSAAQDSIQVRVAGGEVLVPVEIEGRSLDFLLDTGSTASAIDPTAAEALGLTPQGKEEVLKNFRSIQADMVEVANFKLGKSTFDRVKLAEINLAPISGALGTSVDGVLGADLLEGFTFKMVYSRGLLLVGKLDTLGPPGTAVPLRRTSGQFLIKATLISVAGEFVLDTGTNSTNVSWKIWEDLSRTWTPTNVVEGVARAGNPTSSAILVCVPEVTVGGVSLKDLAIRAQKRSDEGAFSSEDFNGILGSDVLRQFEVTFDLQHDQVFLKSDPEYKPDPYRYTTVGIQIGKNGEGVYQIMSVWKDSPAAEGGLQAGDLLEAVNGDVTSGLTPEQISTSLHAKAGTTVKLTIQRDGNASTVTLQTRELLCGPH
jgi:predicted aspartyl protease